MGAALWSGSHRASMIFVRFGAFGGFDGLR